MLKGSRSVLTAICLGSALFWISVYLISLEISYFSNQPHALLAAEYQAMDFRVRNGRKTELLNDIVFVGIDKTNYSDDVWPGDENKHPHLQWVMEEFPWPRQIYAYLLETLFESGAKVVALDLLFNNPGEGDDEFARVLRKYQDRIVIGANIVESTQQIGFITQQRNEFQLPNATIMKALGENASQSLGVVNYRPDPDSVVRSTDLTFKRVNEHYYSFSALIALKAGDTLAGINLKEPKYIRFSGPPDTYAPISIFSILDPTLRQANVEKGNTLKDKIIFVGPYGNWTQDFHNTPYPRMLGPEIHIQTLGSIIHRSFYKHSVIAPDYEILKLPRLEIPVPVMWSGLFLTFTFVTFLGSLPLLYFVFTSDPIKRVAFIIAVGALWVAGTYFLYNQFDIMITTLTPMLALVTSGTGGIVYQFVRDQLEKRQTRATLEKYVSSNVVAAILNRPDSFEDSLGGKRIPCTMLFSDIRGFTSMTENNESQAVVTQLNEYLTEMVDCVFDHDGTLDKFIGDAVMAVWGNASSEGPRTDAIKSVKTARAMLQALKIKNEEWKQRGFPELEIGIGINQGDVIAGDMGSPKRKDFTVIGDAVNLASRLESLTKQYHLPIILGEAVAQLVDNDFLLQPVDLVRVQGKQKPVRIYTLANCNQDDLITYQQAIAAYLDRRFDETISLLKKYQSSNLSDPLSTLYLNRCQKFIESPPPEDWDGLVVIERK
ncbi:MAG: adenylate/guanylate cyclase domain-containing protein [Verrucomicrobiota bacterium]